MGPTAADLRSHVRASQGLEKQPLVSFAEAVAVPSLVAAIPDLPKCARSRAPASVALCNTLSRMFAFLASKAGKQKFAKLGAALGLTADQFAMIYLCASFLLLCSCSGSLVNLNPSPPPLVPPSPVCSYSMESDFYKRLNTELRDRNRAVLVASYFPALRLLLSAINKLPKVQTTVYRGVKKSLLLK